MSCGFSGGAAESAPLPLLLSIGAAMGAGTAVPAAVWPDWSPPSACARQMAPLAGCAGGGFGSCTAQACEDAHSNGQQLSCSCTAHAMMPKAKWVETLPVNKGGMQEQG